MTSILKARFQFLKAQFGFHEELIGTKTYVKIDFPNLEPEQTSFCRYGRGDLYWRDEIDFEYKTDSPHRFTQKSVRLSVYAMDANKISTFLGYAEIDAYTLFNGPYKYEVTLINSKFPGKMQFQCIAVEESKTIIEPFIELYEGNLDSLRIEYYVDIPDHKIFKYVTKPTKDGFQSDTYPLVEELLTLEKLIQSNLIFEIYNNSSDYLIVTHKLSLLDVYCGTNQAEVFEEYINDVQKYSMRLTLLCFPIFCQSIGVHKFNGRIHSNVDIKKLPVLPVEAREMSLFTAFQPIYNELNGSYESVEPVNITLEFQNIQFLMTRVPNKCILVLSNTLNANTLRLTLKEQRNNIYTINNYLLTIQTNSPYLLNRSYLIFSLMGESDNKFLGEYYLNIHTILSGPDNYKINFENVPDKGVVEMQGLIKGTCDIAYFFRMSKLKVLGKRLKGSTVEIQYGDQKFDYQIYNYIEEKQKGTEYVEDHSFKHDYVFAKNKDKLKITLKNSKHGDSSVELDIGQYFPLTSLKTLYFQYEGHKKSRFSLDINMYTSVDKVCYIYPYKQIPNSTYTNQSINISNINDDQHQPLLSKIVDKSAKETPKYLGKTLYEKLKIKGRINIVQISQPIPSRNLVVYLTNDNIQLIYNKEVLYTIKYRSSIKVSYNPGMLFLSTKEVSFIGYMQEAEDLFLQIAHMIDVIEEPEEVLTDVSIEEFFETKELDYQTALEEYLEKIRTDNQYFLICQCQSAVNVTCPMCRDHPEDFRLFNILQLLCPKCYFLGIYQCMPGVTRLLLCQKCQNELSFDTSKCLPTFQCKCARYLGAKCSECFQVPKSKILYSTVLCTSCHRLNIRNKFGIMCEDCNTTLPVQELQQSQMDGTGSGSGTPRTPSSALGASTLGGSSLGSHTPFTSSSLRK